MLFHRVICQYASTDIRKTKTNKEKKKTPFVHERMCAKSQLKSGSVTGCRKTDISLLHERQCRVQMHSLCLGVIWGLLLYGATRELQAESEGSTQSAALIFLWWDTHTHTHRSIYNTITPESRDLEQSCNIKRKRLFCSTSAVSQLQCFYLKRSPPEHFMCFHPAAFLKSGATEHKTVNSMGCSTDAHKFGLYAAFLVL